MYYTYVLWTQAEERFYIGYTADLKRRLAEHRRNKVYTTQRYQQIQLIFYEAFLSQADAKRRENYFKSSKGKKALRMMLRESIKTGQ
ncbi:MAG: hypothetical protein A3G87_09620 [Omnitrophica bacterium RIFCSPLOWO2_12_FULL_50_11]|nr:MAG: hypothetical protein A3G87_09620 [Omnitrophica bacterium RIFCSPLOWO2_12_FULL_50_11]